MVAKSDLEQWRDAVYRLASAIEDVDQDLAAEASLKAYTEAFLHLHGASTEAARFTVEPLAVGD